MRNAPYSADADVRERKRVLELKRDAARISVVEPYYDRSDAKRRNERIDANLGDDHSVDEADEGANPDDSQNRERNGPLAVAEKADDKKTRKARDIADAEIEIAADQRHRQAGGDDRADRHIVDYVFEVVEGCERISTNRGEHGDHHDHSADRAVSAEEATEVEARLLPAGEQRADKIAPILRRRGRPRRRGASFASERALRRIRSLHPRT